MQLRLGVRHHAPPGKNAHKLYILLLFSAFIFMTSSAVNGAELESPDTFSGFDPESHATVRFINDNIKLDIPRNIISGVFVSPDYCPSGKGICGQLNGTQIAILYPEMKPIPVDRIDEFRIFSPAASPELITINIQPPDRELARVAAYLSGSFVENPLPGPFGLERSSELTRIFLAYLKTPDRLSISCPAPEQAELLQQCSAIKYFFGNVMVIYTFNTVLFPQWEDINNKVSTLMQSFSEHK